MTTFSQTAREDIEIEALKLFIEAEFNEDFNLLPVNTEGLRTFEVFGPMTIVIRPFVTENGLFIVSLDAWVDEKLVKADAAIFQIDSFENGIVNYGEIREFSII